MMFNAMQSKLSPKIQNTPNNILNDTQNISQMQSQFSVIKGYGNDEMAN